jgi:hypothetical protein
VLQVPTGLRSIGAKFTESAIYLGNTAPIVQQVKPGLSSQDLVYDLTQVSAHNVGSLA